MSSLPANNVYQGYWVDYSYGPILGSTITLTETASTILVALTAALLSVAGARIWRMLAFFYFLSQASDSLTDGYHQQHQIILRNISSPDTFILTSCKILYRWKGHAKKKFIRILGTLAIAIVCSLAFVIAGVFSAKIVSTGDINILVESPDCGSWNFSNSGASALAEDLGLDAWSANVLSKTQQYAWTCYNSTVADPSCQVFVQQTLPLLGFNTTSCPYSGGCLGLPSVKSATSIPPTTSAHSTTSTHSATSTQSATSEPAIQLDTGLLDSNDMFGINAPLRDRIQFRTRVTCAVIDADKYKTTSKNQTLINLVYGPPLPEEEVYVYSIGQYILAPDSTVDPRDSFVISAYEAARTNNYGIRGALAYFPNQPENNTIVPNPDVKSTYGDQFFIGISLNSVTYSAPCNDPVFAAHRISSVLYNADAIPFKSYLPDNPAGIVGCGMQYQICNPNKQNTCTDLDSSDSVFAQAQALGLNDIQNATNQLFYLIIEDLGLNLNILQFAPSIPLIAAQQHASNSATAISIPDDQWAIEVSGWVNLVLATYQQVITTFALGPGSVNASWEMFTTKPISKAEEQLCHSQKMKAPGDFSNINVFGFSFIIAFCGLVILTEPFLPDMFRVLAKRSKRLSSKMEAWDHCGTLQLQRKAYEALGYGSWENTCKEIPRTAKDDRLASFTSPYLHDSTAAQAEKSLGSSVASHQTGSHSEDGTNLSEHDGGGDPNTHSSNNDRCLDEHGGDRDLDSIRDLEAQRSGRAERFENRESLQRYSYLYSDLEAQTSDTAERSGVGEI